MFNHGCCRLLACLAAWLAGAGAMAADMPKLLPTLPNYDIPFHGKGSFAPTPDGRLYFEAEGSGPPLVLLAGGPGSAHNGFHPWFGQLADRFTVYYVDNIGRGRSDRLPAEQSHRYTVERDAGDVEALRRYLKVDKIAVLGQSAGGQVALEYALAYPDHVSKLILSNPLYNPAHWRLNIEIAKHVTRDYFPEIWEQELAARAKGMQTGDANYPQISSGPRVEYFLHQVQRGTLRYRSGVAAEAPNPDVYAAMLGPDGDWTLGGTLQHYSPENRLPQLAVPTLILAGRWDRNAPLTGVREMANAMPKGIVELAIFEQSAHAAFLEEPDAYFARLGAFLGK